MRKGSGVAGGSGSQQLAVTFDLNEFAVVLLALQAAGRLPVPRSKECFPSAECRRSMKRAAARMFRALQAGGEHA